MAELEAVFDRQYNYLSEEDGNTVEPIFPKLKEHDYLLYDCDHQHKYYILFGLPYDDEYAFERLVFMNAAFFQKRVILAANCKEFDVYFPSPQTLREYLNRDWEKGLRMGAKWDHLKIIKKGATASILT